MHIEEYVKTHKGSTNVTWALFVQDNIKRGDYARLNTGEIVKVIGIKENKINKKAIYFEPYDEYNWFDSMAVKSFSKNIIDLIEEEDIVNGCEVMNIYKPKDIWEPIEVEINSKCTRCFLEGEIKTILTHEQYEQNCYKVGDM